jgi:dihydroorotase-like cyclic amidohydrolase
LLLNTNNRKGTLLIQNGKESSGKAVTPKNTIIVNLEGKSIYPSFIDMYTLLNRKTKELKVEGDKTFVRHQKEGYY